MKDKLIDYHSRIDITYTVLEAQKITGDFQEFNVDIESGFEQYNLSATYKYDTNFSNLMLIINLHIRVTEQAVTVNIRSEHM